MSSTGAKKQNFMHGAAILTVGVIIMKILGAIYKVPLGNILGDYGYGIFLSTYNVYNIFFTLSTAGLPVALSRMIAEADAQGKIATKEKTFRAALLTFAVIGMLFAMIMFFGNEWLAFFYLRKPDAALSVRAIAPAILLVCLVSAYRGYCQGNGNMIPTTVDEVLEVIKAHSRKRTQVMPVTQSFTPGLFSSVPVEVKVGGATVFVLNVERFEKC